MIRWRSLFYFGVLFIAGCGYMPTRDRLRLVEPQWVFQDGHSSESLLALLNNQTKYLLALEAQGIPLRIGPRTINAKDYRLGMELLRDNLQKDPAQKIFAAALMENFDFYEISMDSEEAPLNLNLWHMPFITGTHYAQNTFPWPIYSVPSDLVKIKLRDYAQKFPNLQFFEEIARNRDPALGVIYGKWSPSDNPSEGLGKVEPLPTRAEYLMKQRNRKEKALAWLSPKDFHDLQEKGMGTIQFSDGELLTVQYAADNGRKYISLAEELRPYEQAGFPRSELSPTLSLAESELTKIYLKNPYYVYFREVEKESIITRLGLPYVPERTLAADSNYYPMGVLALIAYTNNQSQITETRVVANQDFLPAVRGPTQFALYAGETIQQPNPSTMKFYFIVPKDKRSR